MSRIRWSTTILIMLVIVVLLVAPSAAGRVLKERLRDGGATVMKAETVKSTVDYWFQRLASGPSPRGRGH
ncbi:unnamed protein product [Cochlearia groenlandica]